MKADLVTVEVQRGERVDVGADPETPKVGRWYWRTSEKDGQTLRRLVCVTTVGSNYAEVRGPEHGTLRIHEDKFHQQCVLEPNPEAVIAQHVDRQQTVIHELMAEVKALTLRLAVTSAPGLPSGEAGALAVYTGKKIDDYKAALVKAEKTTLPDLFRQIKEENALLGKWLGATIIPLEAQAEAMTPAIEAVRDRVFSVELYAGLVESIVQVTDGEPAGATEKLHLFQRRAYMDEECLAQYEVGGMDYKGIEDFDAWLARPANLARLLPFPRCILAFQVRRKAKAREMASIADYFNILQEEALDKLTFLYIRNGARLYRLGTEIEFGESLFPDMTEDQLGSKLYAQTDSDGEVRKLITEAQWRGKVEEERAYEQRAKERRAAAAKMSKQKAREYLWSFHDEPSHFERSEQFKPFDRTNVFYDDIAKHIAAEMKRHNRLVLVLQGLLDRSPVLHPHPPWQLWTHEGFTAALKLHYDNARALSPGDKPDFEAYRARLNESITVGSVTLGQRWVWKERKQSDKKTPYTDRGPPKFARVAAVSKKTGKLTYRWTRERTARTYEQEERNKALGPIGCKIVVKARRVFNVDAYTPGDFKLFFGDPRTRADYLQWAPLLLEAEEYHAGNREKPEPLPAAPPKRRVTPGGSYEYQKRKRLKALLGKAGRFAHNITTRGGTTYKKGSLWRVTYVERGALHVMGIQPDGAIEPPTPDCRSMRGIGIGDLVIDDTIPVDPKYLPEPAPKRWRVDDEDDE